ncbi:hypothetical protein JCM3775_004652 [Rhodotorula graminis]|uniref:Non-haem dioxygenase N-terminal domain-containing protein n=1 Tax=Rhodotorula graminis (strain WP1) TaxID=578459 RepID=A0A194S8V1_RHOGW|nr:uncharacterized protein RHOBADRAFT_42113 [Rhodotorula graminis WP1]KPV76900.1 hypothetical protein RHOBADRAFT_42113 [Rhodotorula graminis WP1]
MADPERIQPVVIPYPALISGDSSLASLVQQGFDSSPDALGLVVVSDLPPEFPQLRQRLLHLSNSFASLPAATREKYAHPGSRFSVGWSHGKEVMNGKPDLLKGSFYNNPSYDLTPGLHDGDEPVANIWPDERGVEGFEEAFKELCALMVRIGILVGAACDQLVGKTASSKSVEQLVKESHSSKARLLHYFPRDGASFTLPPSSSVPDEPYKPEEVDDSWCGTHIDHSLLTVLCPSLYLFHPDSAPLDPLVIPAPAPSTGLFIKTRGGKVVQATIPADCVALQTGETLELLTSKRLAATPHFVNATAANLGTKALQAIERKKEDEPQTWGRVESGFVTRETLAVFLQPNHDEVVADSGETFGEFSARVFKRHYDETE